MSTSIAGARVSPLAFVDEYGQANLDVSIPDVGTHFVLTAVLVEPESVERARAMVDEIRARHFQTGELRSKGLAKNPVRFRTVLEELREVPFTFYAVVVDKRDVHVESGLAFKNTFHKYIAGLLYRKLFGAFPDLHVKADAFGREAFMDGFSKYVIENHRDTLFDRPRVEFVDSKTEPLVQLADVVCGVLARTYDSTKTTEKSAELLAIIRPHALMIDEWPVRFHAASGTGLLTAADPDDDAVARYSVARAEDFLETNEARTDEDVRAQCLVLKKLLYEMRFGEPGAHTQIHELHAALRGLGETHNDHWLRSTVLAPLRDAGVLIASSPQGGYKLPTAIRDVSAFVVTADTTIHPLLNRVARARDAVKMLTNGRVDVLAGDKLSLLRAAVDAIPEGQTETTERNDG